MAPLNDIATATRRTGGALERAGRDADRAGRKLSRFARLRERMIGLGGIAGGTALGAGAR